MIFSILAVILGTIFSKQLVLSQIPRTLSYQGVLADSLGNPKPNGTYNFTFRLYTVSSGGSPVWTETRSLPVRRGLFSAILGNITPIPDSVKFAVQYYLGIRVAPDPEIPSRIMLSSTAYSFNALRSDTARYAFSTAAQPAADSARIAGTVPNNSLNAPKIAAGQVMKRLNGLTDVITLRGGGGATVTSNADTIIVSAGGGSGTGIQGVQSTNNTLDISNPTGPTATVNVKVPLILSGSYSTGILTAVNSDPAGTAIRGMSAFSYGISGSSTFQAGVFGIHTDTSGTVAGVSGITSSNDPDGSGVEGYSNVSNGVRGSSISGTGVRGSSLNNSGMYGETPSVADETAGVFGRGISPAGRSVGVWGDSRTSPDGIGIVGRGSAKGAMFVGWSGIDVTGVGDASSAAGNFLSFDGTGVYGYSYNSTGVAGTGKTGVYGYGSLTGSGVEGTTPSSGESIAGVYGHSVNATGVIGISENRNGIYGISTGGNGVYGTSSYNDGVHGHANSANKSGVYGEHLAGARGALGVSVTSAYPGNKFNAGVVADAGSGDDRCAIVALAGAGANNTAGQFDGIVWISGGDLYVAGKLAVSGDKSFMIDHPLDPGNKYLFHSCVESNEQLDIYSGTVTTDGQGVADVHLPSYFEALNKEFRYQLTVIGQFANAIIGREIEGNQFTIRSDRPGIKVSWQVTGARNDAYAKAHPFVVERDKGAQERGKYLMPDLYGLDKSFGIGHMDRSYEGKER